MKSFITSLALVASVAVAVNIEQHYLGKALDSLSINQQEAAD